MANFPKSRYNHNDVNIGNRVEVDGYNDNFIVTDVLDGFRGVGIARGFSIHSKERLFVDISQVTSIKKG